MKMNFQANKHNRQLCLALLFVILTVTGVSLYLRLYMCADQTSMERSISIQKISEISYWDALDTEKKRIGMERKNYSLYLSRTRNYGLLSGFSAR